MKLDCSLLKVIQIVGYYHNRLIVNNSTYFLLSTVFKSSPNLLRTESHLIEAKIVIEIKKIKR
jgi:hypothetical protein